MKKDIGVGLYGGLRLTSVYNMLGKDWVGEDY